jgi:flavin reductase (DIM6/NTAB) family NADH-FMN oxidoreductase RutF
VDVEMVPSEMIAPPRVKASPIHLECKLWKVIDLPADSNSVRNAMIVGQVVGIHISDDVLVNGFIDLAKVKPLARLGYLDYSVVDEIFQMRRPPGGD